MIAGAFFWDVGLGGLFFAAAFAGSAFAVEKIINRIEGDDAGDIGQE